MAQRILYMVMTAVLLFAGAGVLFAQDLTVQIKNCPRSVKAGQNLDSSFRVAVTNNGAAAVKDVAVEIVLKKNTFCPVPTRHAEYSRSYFDGVLLQGGRESVSLAPGKTVAVPLHGMNTIPWDTPVGRTYYLCAVVDAGDTVKETSEENNCACCPVKVTEVEEKPQVTGYGETCIARGGTVTILGRNFGSEAGKAVFLGGSGINVNLRVISWGDSSITAAVPDDLRIQDGQRYFIGIRETGKTGWLSNTGTYIATCPRQQPGPAPRPVPPVPPFLH